MLSTPGERIKRIRRSWMNAVRRPLTLREFGAWVAEREGRAVAWPTSTVSRWEHDQFQPKPGAVAAIAALGGTTPEELMSPEGPSASSGGVWGTAIAEGEPPAGEHPAELSWLFGYVRDLYSLGGPSGGGEHYCRGATRDC